MNEFNLLWLQQRTVFWLEGTPALCFVPLPLGVSLLDTF